MTYVDTRVTDGVALLTLNDPEKRNAINAAMNEELLETFEQLEVGDEVRAVVITGTAPAFCAGADLSALISSGNAESLTDIYRGFLRVAHSPLPTLAAVNGPAVGAGMNMALACDVILAGRSARFDCRFLQIGLHPGGGHTWRLVNKTTEQVAKAMVLFGEILDGEQAERCGLAWKCVDDDQLMAEAWRMASRAASFPGRTLRATKNTFDAIRKVDTSVAAVEAELSPQAMSSRSPEFIERTSALREQIRSTRPQ
jgi:enoyl-CoA hydratase